VATGKDLRRLALAMDGTVEYPHFDRTAFKLARTYVTLAPDERTANFKFAPDEQELKCTVAPDAFTPISNAWGRQGWTVATLSKLRVAELRAALAMAYTHGAEKKSKRRKPPSQHGETRRQ
jgi:hypothetical protein